MFLETLATVSVLQCWICTINSKVIDWLLWLSRDEALSFLKV